MTTETHPAVSEAMREGILHDDVQALIAVAKQKVAERDARISTLASEIARLTGERDAAVARADRQAELRNEAEAEGLKHYRQLREGVPAMMLIVEGARQATARADAAEAELTRMRAENDRLRAALQDVADIAPEARPDHWDCELDQVCWNLAQTARAALSNSEQTDA